MSHAVDKIPMNVQNCTDMGATWRNFRKDQPPPKLLPRRYDSSLLAHLAHSTAGFRMAGLLSVSGAMSTWPSHADCKIQQLCPNLAPSPFPSIHTYRSTVLAVSTYSRGKEGSEPEASSAPGRKPWLLLLK